MKFAGSKGTILSNFPIKVLNCRMISPYDLVRLLEGGRVEGKVCLALQEVYGWMNSHKSLSKINDFESAFVFQAAKLGYTIFWDSQIAMRVDSSLRDMSSYRFECEKKKDRFVYYLLDNRVHGQDVRVKGKCFRIPFALARTFWDLYDTHTGLLPLGYREMVAEMEALEPDLMNKRIEGQVDLLLRERDKFGFWSERGCSVVAVKDALLQLGEPVAFASYVSNRLRLRLLSRRELERRTQNLIVEEES